jgi:hypothetical protein
VKRLVRELQVQEIQRVWDEGIQSGPGHFQDLDELIQETERQNLPDKAHEDQR